MDPPKLLRWKSSSSTEAVIVDSALDLTTLPSSTRATFPGLTPFRILSAKEAFRLVVDVPHGTAAAWTSFIVGVLWALLLLQKLKSKAATVLQVLVAAVSMLSFHIYALKQQPTVKPVSTMINVSSSPRGPCRVVANVLSLSNSHAGTHADTPFHFDRDAGVANFDDAHYSGSVCIVNIEPLLGGSSVITAAMIQSLMDLHPVLRIAWRIVFRTFSLADKTEDKWRDNFAHFDPEAALALGRLPNLILVGIDTPSVDGPSVSPICEGAHGAFHSNDVAIIENLRLNSVDELLSNPAVEVEVLRGSLLTVFNPCMSFEDSRGCSVLYFPARD